MLQLTPAGLAGAKDVAEYPRVLLAEEATTLDADLIEQDATRTGPKPIAEHLTAQYARWDDRAQARTTRRAMADWQVTAARRACINAERA